MSTLAFPEWQTLGSASSLNLRWQQQLQPFWQQMRSGVLTSSDGLRLSYYFHRTPGAQHAVLISAGRMEMAVKYSELCFELVSAGYSVFILDHRGQGLSQRQLSNRHKGYVTDFSSYQQDLAQFVQQIMLPTGHSQHLALAHSMGSAILAGYLQQQPHPFQAVIMASPMLGIYTGLVPASIAEPVALAYAALNRLFSRDSWYFPGQQNYQEKVFDNNPLTSCAERYCWLLRLYQHYPDAQLGGVTSHWVSAAIKAMRRLQQDAAKWHTPVLLLQAAADKVVSNFAQQSWYQQLPQALYRQKVALPAAKHEIFMESDQIRQQAFIAINQFLRQLPA
uniref:Lysophospholipase L2 n=1 Tax=Rheinheimera sp. BAL341 TaxID=1708203 RepID=A0A486XMY3_9GAMM